MLRKCSLLDGTSRIIVAVLSACVTTVIYNQTEELTVLCAVVVAFSILLALAVVLYTVYVATRAKLQQRSVSLTHIVDANLVTTVIID